MYTISKSMVKLIQKEQATAPRAIVGVHCFSDYGYISDGIWAVRFPLRYNETGVYRVEHGYAKTLLSDTPFANMIPMFTRFLTSGTPILPLKGDVNKLSFISRLMSDIGAENVRCIATEKGYVFEGSNDITAILSGKTIKTRKIPASS
jgi:hypothetical protein